MVFHQKKVDVDNTVIKQVMEIISSLISTFLGNQILILSQKVCRNYCPSLLLSIVENIAVLMLHSSVSLHNVSQCRLVFPLLLQFNEHLPSVDAYYGAYNKSAHLANTAPVFKQLKILDKYICH